MKELIQAATISAIISLGLSPGVFPIHLQVAVGVSSSSRSAY